MEGKKGGRKMKEKNCNDDREKDNEKKKVGRRKRIIKGYPSIPAG